MRYQTLARGEDRTRWTCVWSEETYTNSSVHTRKKGADAGVRLVMTNLMRPITFSLLWTVSGSERTWSGGASGRLDMHIRSLWVLPSEGVTSLFGSWAINRGVSRPWLRLSTLRDFVSLLESAREPSNLLVLVRVRIDCE